MFHLILIQLSVLVLLNIIEVYDAKVISFCFALLIVIYKVPPLLITPPVNFVLPEENLQSWKKFIRQTLVFL